MCYSALAVSGHYCLQVTIAPAYPKYYYIIILYGGFQFHGHASDILLHVFNQLMGLGVSVAKLIII